MIAEQAPEQAEGLDRIRALVGETIQSIRGVTRNLRPVALDDLGLLASLRAMARDLAGREGALDVTFDAPPIRIAMHPDAELALYRTTQEAMANAVRHGGARAIRIEVDSDDEGVELSVHDDGAGFPPGFEIRGNSRHTGLAGLRERVTAVGGHLEVGDTEMGGGRVTARVPWTHTKGAGE